MYRKAILGLFTLTAVLVSTAAFAQTGDDAVIYQAFGRGVHYYNAQNYSAAFDELTKCVDNSSKNPSVYYFRGLALMNLGREDDAIIDFKKGAELEGVSISSVQKQIGYDLQFVQGEIRQTLEVYRASAKLAAYEKAREIAALQENIDAKNVDTSVGYWANDGYIYNGQTGSYEEYDTPDAPATEEDGEEMLDGEEAEDGEASEDGDDFSDDFGDEEEEEEAETLSIEDAIDSEEADDDDADAEVSIDDEIGGVDFGGDDDDSAFGDDDDDDAALAGDDDDDDAAL
ncbi:MAG: hypothetical protein Q4C70_12295, partial [Planctomycetia bacterium]|nr:hypothetical protein [Planctomycetia bacterium]